MSIPVQSEDCGVSPFTLNVGGVSEQLRREFQATKRVRVANFLQEDSALALHLHLSREVVWRTFIVARGRLLAGPLQEGSSCSQEVDRNLCERAHQAARSGFASLCEANRAFAEELPTGTPTARVSEPLPWSTFFDLLNSPAFLPWIREVTGNTLIARVDIQATRHRPGHFCGFANGPPFARGRSPACGAFVLNLTIEWKYEWGGLLHFRRPGCVAEAYAPSFNVLDIFTFPQGHWISAVAPYADRDRLTISGRLYAE